MKQFFLASLLGSSIALCSTAMAADVDLKALEAAARAEGAVNSVGMPDEWANWKGTWADLNKLYGLKHIDTDMSSAQEVAKFAAEKDNASADIGDVGAAFGPIAVAKGVTQPYKPTTWEQIPDWAKDKDGNWALAYTGTIAFIGGMELDTTKGKYEGYKEAAAYVAEKAGKTATTLDIVYSNSFSASDKGIEFAKAMIDKGADVFFGAASAVDSGARQAIDEYNAAQGSVKVFDIAQPADLLGQNECIICSQVTDNSAMVGSCMEAVEAGKLGGDVIYGTLENGALSAGAVSDLVPAEIKDQYNAYIEEMKAGTFMK